MARSKQPKGKAAAQSQEAAKKLIASVPPPAPAPVREKRQASEVLSERGIDWLTDEIIAGRSLRTLADGIGCSASSILRWVKADPERLAAFTLAREVWAESVASEVIEIADHPVPMTGLGSYDSAAVQQRRLQVDTRKWVAAKMLPKVYGEKIDVTSGGNPMQSLSEKQIDARLVMLLGAAGLNPQGDKDEGKDGE